MPRPLSALPLMLALSLLLASCASTGSAAVSVASISGDGEYRVMSYTDIPDVPEFAGATVYYPADTPGPVGGVAISPGWTERQRHIEWWGPRLASHGFAVLILDTNVPREDQPAERAAALVAAISTLRGENTRSGSPLAGRIDPNKMAVMGHSMGGGGTLLVANEHSDMIKAAIPFTPWEPDATFEGITVPTLILAGSVDRISPVAEHAWPHFQSIPESTTKAFIEFGGADHYIADTTRGEDLATVGRLGIAWLKLYLDGDERYRDFIYGERVAGDEGKFSRYITNR